ncbi:hypothetical protein F5051DRAFT_505644 [Lentinula edodes]|nr:hypothetical protein F5051DRAFT_505644 [Lentinula edodes]
MCPFIHICAPSDEKISQLSNWFILNDNLGSAIWGSFMSKNQVNATGTAPIVANLGKCMVQVGASYIMVQGVIAVAAYWLQDDPGVRYSWAMDHSKYVWNLWDEDALKRGINLLIEIEKMERDVFLNVN